MWPLPQTLDRLLLPSRQTVHEWKLENVQAYLELSGQDEEDAHLLADYSKDNKHIEIDPAKVRPDIDLWIKSLQPVDAGYKTVYELIQDGRRPPEDVYEQWEKSEKAGDKQPPKPADSAKRGNIGNAGAGGEEGPKN